MGGHGQAMASVRPSIGFPGMDMGTLLKSQVARIALICHVMEGNQYMTSISPVRSSEIARTATAPAVPGSDEQLRRRRLGRSHSTSFVPVAPRKAVKDMTVQERFATLQKRFVPSRTKGVNVKFQFDISGSGGGKWYCTIKDQKLTVKEGTGPNPTATLKASAEDYLKIANGEMNKMLAFIRGKLKVSGDKDELKKWDTYFKES